MNLHQGEKGRPERAWPAEKGSAASDAAADPPVGAGKWGRFFQGARARTESGKTDAGQAIEFRLNCAGEGTTLRHPNSPWLYSDLPAAGKAGRLYQDHRFVPPGPHFLNLRPEAEATAAASVPEAGDRSRSLC